MQDCESTEPVSQDQKSGSVIEDKKRVSSSGRYQESSDITNHFELSYRQRDERENGEMSVVTAV